MKRSVADHDDSRKHFISYCVVTTASGLVMCYRRGVKGGESRLHGLYSVGVGGHVTRDDMADPVPPHVNLAGAALREVLEEIEVTGNLGRIELVGYVNDDSNDVGRVHLGFVWEFRPEGLVKTSSASLLDAAFLKVEHLKRVPASEFETWSAMIIPSMVPPTTTVF